MAFGLNDPAKQQAILVSILIAGAGYVFYQYLWSPLHEERVAVEQHQEQLEMANEQARAVTQPRRIQELQQLEAEYQVALAAYETMLPSQLEVSSLLEDIAFVALEDDVAIVAFAPLEELRSEHLVEVPYDLQVQGGYHQIGGFLAEVVDLPRLVRPAVVSLEQVEVTPATETTQAEYAVLAKLVLSTFLPAGAAVPARVDAIEEAPAAAEPPAGIGSPAATPEVVPPAENAASGVPGEGVDAR